MNELHDQLFKGISSIVGKEVSDQYPLLLNGTNYCNYNLMIRFHQESWKVWKIPFFPEANKIVVSVYGK